MTGMSCNHRGDERDAFTVDGSYTIVGEGGALQSHPTVVDKEE